MRGQLLATLGLLSSRPIFAETPQSGLYFSSSGQFKISIFEDLHFGEDEFSTWAPQHDAQTLRVMANLLEAENPNFVVLNGDLVTGENTYLDNSTDYIDMLVAPLVAASTPWASTYGNHDINYNSSTDAFLARERNYPLSYTNQMVFGLSAGVSNYYVPIYATPADTTPSLLLYFFDSRGGRAFQQLDADGKPFGVPSTVDPSVTSWFRSTSAALASQYNRHIPSLAFVHIPTSQMAAFSSSSSGVDPNREPGVADEPLFRPQSDDAAFVDALLATEGLLAVFSGHQHGNDWCMGTPRSSTATNTSLSQEAPPLFACFGRHTGWGGYGTWERGARQVLVDIEALADSDNGTGSPPELETWVRLEGGGISGHVMLNSTYGQDMYPQIRKTHTRLDGHGKPEQFTVEEVDGG